MSYTEQKRGLKREREEERRKREREKRERETEIAALLDRVMLLAKDQALVCPGDKLSEVDDALPGNGTHVFEGFIVSSLLGRLKYAYASLSAGPIQQQNEGETKAATTSTSKPTLSVTIEGRGIEGGEASAPPIPLALAIGDEVLAKVRSLNPRYASATIVCKETIPLVKEFSGIIRVQDVRSSEIDKVRTSLDHHRKPSSSTLSFSPSTLVLSPSHFSKA